MRVALGLGRSLRATELVVSHRHSEAYEQDSPQLSGPPGSGDLVSTDEWAQIAESFGLSRRLAEVLELAFGGMTEPEIAMALGIAQSTVHKYGQRLYRKLGIHSRSELHQFVFREVVRIRS